jgi:hypothetical protein
MWAEKALENLVTEAAIAVSYFLQFRPRAPANHYIPNMDYIFFHLCCNQMISEKKGSKSKRIMIFYFTL